jgi:hypothetical protein
MILVHACLLLWGCVGTPLQVASVLVAALAQPAAVNKVVEIVGTPTAPALAADKWFDV